MRNKPKVLENQSTFERINTVPGQQTYAIVTRTPQQAQQGKAKSYSEINYQKYSIHLVIEETKSLPLVTATLVELLKKDLRRMLMVRMYILNVLLEQALHLDYYVVRTLADESPINNKLVF